MEELIPITADLVHRITHFLGKGNDPRNIARMNSDVGIAEIMKAKYKLEKQKQGYVIASIKYQGVRIATQLLARKLMRKFNADEVLAPIIVRAERCTEGVQFNWA